MNIRKKTNGEMIATLKKYGYQKCKYNLSHANLSGVDLHGVDLTDSDLRNTNLCYANLSYVNLFNANLSCADLRNINLSCANLSYTNLFNADLSYTELFNVDLSCADLSGLKWGYNPSKLLAKLERTENGFIAYKSFNKYRKSPLHWKQEIGSIITENVNPNVLEECGCGINVGTLKWCKDNVGPIIWKVEIPYIAQIVVPFNTDGKFRVNQCKLLEIVK